MRRFVRDNSLTLFFGVIFVASLLGQAFAGWYQFNAQQAAEQLAGVSLLDYLASADFAVDVSENWQSEFLQFYLYLMVTVWLVQVGSPESKKPSEAGLESDEEQKVGPHAESASPAWAAAEGWRRVVYSNSLAWLMGSVFLASWTVQSIAGWAAFNETRLQQLQDAITWVAYLRNADFWSRTLQNWQSEFLAIGSMAVFAVYLRQRGSSQSEPVGSPHETTGIDG